MPWAIFTRPSIQLAALKASLAEKDPTLTVNCHHHYLEVASRLGGEEYQWMARSGWAGEALYAPLLYPEMADSSARLFGKEQARFRKVRRGVDFGWASGEISRCLGDFIKSIPWQDIDLVGLTVCFNQFIPALVVAREIKAIRPELPLVFGGSSCAGLSAQSILDEFQWVDFVISGEGEAPLGELVDFLRGEVGQLGPNVLTREDTSFKKSPQTQLLLGKRQAELVVGCPSARNQLASLPCPDYRDYFNEIGRYFPGAPFVPTLPVEFSRGCWWGKCTFCNLNLQWDGYRAKTAVQVYDEVKSLAATHGCLDFTFTDNVLPVREAREFFAMIAASNCDYSFFAELRASQRYDFPAFRVGGLRTAQVGIEALSPGLLRRMNKGVTVMDNVAAMKEAVAAGIVLEGNLILGFPGSTADEVRETLEVLAFLLPFLPLDAAFFFLGRNSPVDQFPDQYGIRSTGPHPRMRALLPAGPVKRLDFLVKGYRGDLQHQQRIWRPVKMAIAKWHDFHRRRIQSGLSGPPLSYRDGGGFLLVRQEQTNSPVLHHRLRGLSRRIYLACEKNIELDTLAEIFPEVSRQRLVAFLGDLEFKKIVFRENENYLSLAVPQRGLEW